MQMIIDPRCGRKTKHDCAEMLVCLVVGYLVGRDSIRRSLKWCESHMDFLRKHMPLRNGIASPATISRLLSGIDEEMFCLVFIEWMTGILNTKGINIAIDGKALRGSTERIKDGKTPYILNAIDIATTLVIGQIPVGEKTNEITAIPKLLELLNIRESTVTIDAIGTTSNIMNTIRANGAEYLLTVKKGNPLTYQEMQEMFTELKAENEQLSEHADKAVIYEKQMETYEVYKTSEKNRSRMEYRTIQTCQNTEMITLCKTQNEIQTVAWLEQVRIPMEKDSEGNDITPGYESFLRNGSVRKPKITTGDRLTDDIHQVGLLSSRKMSAQEMLAMKRNHWRIENSLHHVLDELFHEDRSAARNSKNNMAGLRKFAYNILRLAIMAKKQEPGPTEMRDEFSDNLTLVETYVFKEVAHL